MRRYTVKKIVEITYDIDAKNSYCAMKGFGTISNKTENVLSERAIDITAEKPIILICGKSCSGKTTLANELSRFGLEQIVSYTTRPKRSDDEKGHLFVTEAAYEQQKALDSIKYEAEIYGYKYWCTNYAFDNGDIYIVDPETVGDVINDLLNGPNPRPFLLIHTWANQAVRWYRFGKRGTELDDILKRERKESCWDDIIFGNIQEVMDMENVKCIKVDTSNDDPVKQAKSIYEEIFFPMSGKIY